MTDLEDTQRTIATLLPVIGGMEAERFLTDLEWALGELDEGAKVIKTQDPACRFEASLRFEGAAEATAQGLVELWTGRLAFGDQQAHRLTVAEDEVELRILTWRHGVGMATGRIVARRRGQAAALRIHADDAGTTS